MRVAFYDLDRTVTRLPTWTAFLVFAALRRAPWRLGLLPAVAMAALAKRAGLLSRDKLKELMHAFMLGRSLPALAEASLAEAFARRVLARNVRPGARARMSADRNAGYRVVLATAAHRFYAEPIARGLGIADIVATEAMRSAEGDLLNRLAGANVYGRAKLAAVEKWLAREGMARAGTTIRFYSDHATDALCLEFADEPFVVNPDRRFRREAQARGWQVLDWNVPGEALREENACAR
ncbi:HAD family hydrolase [Sphingomonas sp. DT-51]